MKSPMQKISHVGLKLANRGSQLYDSASSAVAHGAQLSNVVASKAGAKADELKEQMRSPDRKERPSMGGIRDRINKFDSASKSRNVEYHHHGRRGGTAHRRGAGGGGGGYETVTPIPPPCNPGFYEKENEPSNQKQSSNTDYTFTSRDGVKKLTPSFRRKKSRQKMEVTCPPANPSYRENEGEVAWNEKQARRSHWNNNGTDRNDQPQESKNGDRRQERNGQHTTIENMAVDIAELNRAAVMPNSKNKTYHSHAAARSNKQKHHNTYGFQRTKKRNPVDHPLIQSPLRKHIKGVHDSASSNATCTMLKDPFMLLPPDQQIRPLAAVANWEESVGGMGHLDTLGSVTGTLKMSGGGRTNTNHGGKGGGADDSICAEKDEGALDLLTSAAFLFKHSRRNLG